MGATIREQFSERLLHEYFIVVTGSASAVAFPTGTATLARFATYGANIGPFFIGANGTTLVYPLKAGEDSGWFMVQGSNLNRYSYRNPSGSSDKLAVWVQY